jgi:2-C-methyl-D-erythritol 4-phosphate cytidylyltransferase
MVSAIVVAAGKGIRMRADTKKQYLHMGGDPIIVKTLRTFGECSFIDCICLVAPGEDKNYCRTLVRRVPEILEKCSVISGGETRQASVYNGLVALEKRASGSDPVLIHDGVRPLVTREHIKACLSSVLKNGTGVLAVPAHDTLKQAAENSNIIEATLTRRHVWLAQTPQAFTYALIRNAHERAREDGFSGTDDAMLVERLSHPVHIVPGSKTNLKITTPEDLALAEALVAVSS